MGQSLVQRSRTECLSRNVVRYNIAYEFQGYYLEMYTFVETRISLYRPRCGFLKMLSLAQTNCVQWKGDG